MQRDLPGRYRPSAAMLWMISLLALSDVRAVTAPYSDNFDSYAHGTAPSGFVTSVSGLNANSSWAIANNGTNGQYMNSLFANQGNTSTAIAVTNLSGSDFLFSSTFVLGTPFTMSGFYDCTVGIAGFVSSSTLNSDPSGYHVTYQTFSLNAPFVTPGSLSLAGVETFLPGSGSTLAVAAGQTYTITLAGVYTPSGLMLTASLTDGIDTISRSGLDSTPATGTFFGYSSAVSASVQRAISSSVSFDNLAITVPEPSTVTCLLVGAITTGITLVRGRRRRRGH